MDDLEKVQEAAAEGLEAFMEKLVHTYEVSPRDCLLIEWAFNQAVTNSYQTGYENGAAEMRGIMTAAGDTSLLNIKGKAKEQTEKDLQDFLDIIGEPRE